MIIWVEKTIGWTAIAKQWQTLPLLTLAVCSALTLLSHALRGARLVYCYQQLNGHPKFDAFTVVAISFIHNAANFIFPMRLGEIVLPALSRYKLSISLKDSIKVLLGIRLFDLHVLIFLLVLLQKSLLGVWQIPLVIILFAGLCMLPFCQHIKYIKALYPPQYRSFTTVAATYSLSLIVWSVKLMAFYWIFNAFAAIPFVAAATGILTADLSSTLPINGFASAGSYEAAFAAGLYATGSLHEALIAAIINLHIFLLLSNIVAAAVGWFILAIKK